MADGAVALRRDDRFGNRSGVFPRDTVAEENRTTRSVNSPTLTVCGIGLYYSARSTIMAEQND